MSPSGFVRGAVLLSLTLAFYGFCYWAADGYDPLLFRPVLGGPHPRWTIEPFGALTLGCMMAVYVFAVGRATSSRAPRWVLLGAATFATVLLALWPDIYGTLRFGSTRVIEWQIDNLIGAGVLRDGVRWIGCGLLQLMLVWALTVHRGERVANGDGEGSHK